VQVSCAALTKRSISSEHPDGVLIEEAAKKWLPELYEEWRRALERWEAVGRPDHDPGTISLDGWGTSRPAVRNPIKAAVEETGRALREACRRKLTTREWSATAMRGSPASAPERIDGDFFLDAWIALDGSGYASAGRGRRKVEIYGLRVRRAADLNEPHPAETKASPSHEATRRLKREGVRKPKDSARIKYSPGKVPRKFSQWAKEQQAKGKLIIETDAVEAMKRTLPPEPSRSVVRGWLKSLPPSWRAERGIRPKKANRGN
jgi:hypothetical protein